MALDTYGWCILALPHNDIKILLCMSDDAYFRTVMPIQGQP